MNEVIDLSQLRELTDGDKEMELALFEMFESSFNQTLESLEQLCSDEANDNWRKESHALKGTAANIGAGNLANICATSQAASSESANKKRELLDAIKAEYSKVLEYLKGLY